MWNSTKHNATRAECMCEQMISCRIRTGVTEERETRAAVRHDGAGTECIPKETGVHDESLRGCDAETSSFASMSTLKWRKKEERGTHTKRRVEAIEYLE